MADIIPFPNQDERSIAQFIEGFGLEYPKDAEKFFEIFFEQEDGEKTVGELFDELIEAFPDKKESILNFPMYAEVDGELVRVRFPDKD
jgi:hypothetical protein